MKLRVLDRAEMPADLVPQINVVPAIIYLCWTVAEITQDNIGVRTLCIVAQSDIQPKRCSRARAEPRRSRGRGSVDAWLRRRAAWTPRTPPSHRDRHGTLVMS